MSDGSLFVVSAPSGAGKTTLSRLVFDAFDGMESSVSYTTRAPRPGERDGVDYRFVTNADFDAMLARGAFAEWAVVHDNRYGTARADLEAILARGVDVLMDIDVQGARQMRANYRGGVYIFIAPPSMEVCEARIRGRGSMDEAQLRVRVANAKREIEETVSYDYIIINDVLEDAAARLKAIIIAERSSRRRMIGRINAIFNIQG